MIVARGIVIASIGLYALATLGALLSRPNADTPSPDITASTQDTTETADPTVPPPAKPYTGKPLRAIGMQLQRTDWTDEYKKSIDEIAAVGADAVKFVVDARQENGSSSRIWIDLRLTPSTGMLQDLIRYAKSKNLRVILMPIVLLDNPRGGEWRGTISPESWPQWWASYRSMLSHYAWIAEGTGVDVFVVGSELVSTTSKLDDWRKTIAQVRSIYKGYLTYSANWDAYEGIPFWNDLDLIGMNSYWKMGETADVTVDDIKRSWRPIIAKVGDFARRQRKPLLILEVGWCSMDNAAREPWDYTQMEPVNEELQQRLYQAFFESWYGQVPNLAGFSMWEWTPGDIPEGAPDDMRRGYTPEGKLAEQTLREWFAKPAWEVGK
jgi:hypothetical protein